MEIKVWLNSEELEMLERLEKKLGSERLWRAIFEAALQESNVGKRVSRRGG